MYQPAWQAQKVRGRRKGQKRESGKKGREPLLQEPVFLYSARSPSWAPDSAHHFLNYPLSPIPFHFSLPPYPLPISTPATQAKDVYRNQFVT